MREGADGRLTGAADGALALDDDLEELADLGEGAVHALGGAEQAQQGLGVEHMLGDDTVGLAERAHAHDAGVALDGVEDGVDGRGRFFGATASATQQRLTVLGLVAAVVGVVEPELVQVQAHQLDLSLEVVAEANDAGAAFGGPAVRYLLQLGRVEATAVELRLDVQIKRIGQGILELAVQQRLLAWVQRDGETLGAT